MRAILGIVEGDGDLEAVPELTRRILIDAGIHDVRVLRPHKRGDLPKVRGQFENFMRTAMLEGCPILWVMDYDCATCNDAARDRSDLIAQAQAIDTKQPIEFVFMIKEFETLFLADWETTRMVFPDIPSDLAFPDDPERVRDAKGWLKAARPKGASYKPTQHQKRLAAQVDLQRLEVRSPSFKAFKAAVLNLARRVDR